MPVSRCDNKDLLRPIAPTGDGQTLVERHRPGHTTEPAVIAPAVEGRPLNPGEELATLRSRGDGTHEVVASYRHGPVQVATSGYRDGWERTFNAPGGSA